ncbi:Hint domain-containing protein [uncultured Tateyamaria sp.]|uniref:Hint domain-containing protein n=1 Tax=Tateyamaria sp. 1078 TaxID=3417464 RepID=UPI00260FE117|nr:Hint domain-containing protein [uncultured Tateyamaria sp.]
MPYTFFAENNEFAAATGSNVNYSPGYSRFDYPPTSTRNLTITSQAGDSDPRLFEVGEVYSVSFTGNGAATITNATIIRSDYTTANDGTPIEGNEGAIVFEGLDENGNLTQVVWSPNFDLETWYFDNFTGGGEPPGFYTNDLNSSETVRFACFAAGTLIRVPGGEMPVEDLNPGDLVLTYDRGPKEVVWRAHSVVPGLGRAAPVTVLPDWVGGAAPLVVSPQHRIMLRHPAFETYFSSTEILISAKHLVDGVSVTKQARAEMSYYHLLCEDHEILIANGVPAESLLLGDAVHGVMSQETLDAFEADSKARWSDLSHPFTARPVVRRKEAHLVRDAFGLQQRDTSRPVPAMFYAA